MASITEILARIDEKAPYAMVIEASVRDYCVLALQFLKGEADFGRYFESALPNPFPGMEEELKEQKHARERYDVQLYKPAEEALLADAIADLAFAQSQRLTLATPATPQADDRERACVYITAVYTLFALTLHRLCRPLPGGVGQFQFFCQRPYHPQALRPQLEQPVRQSVLPFRLNSPQRLPQKGPKP